MAETRGDGRGIHLWHPTRAKSVNYVFQDRPWLSLGDVAATTLRRSSLQGDGVPPLPQVLWHHEALTVAFLATEDSLPQFVERIRYVRKQLSVAEIHLVVLCSTDCPLYDGAAFFKEKAPWAWIEMATLSRPLSGVGGRLFYAWHMRTTAAHFSQQSPPKPLLKARPLLAPDTEPTGLFVPVRPPAGLWAVSLPTRQVDDLLKAVVLRYDQVQLREGPSRRSDTQWALLPGVLEERRPGRSSAYTRSRMRPSCRTVYTRVTWMKPPMWWRGGSRRKSVRRDR